MRRIYLMMLVLLASAMQLRAQNNWMASLPDNVYITQLSIPGAHDAATSGMTLGINKTQALTIPNQWEAGVRAFDLRPKKDGTIYHSSFSTGITLTQALGYLKTKLQANPTEFAIVLMRNESNGGANEDGWQTAIKSILDAYAAADGNYRGTVEWNNRLRLSDVRGKILILTRDAVDNTRAVTIGSWADDATHARTSLYNDQFRIVYQDKYSDGASNTKKEAITALLNEAMTIHNPFRLYLNHTSASTSPSSYASTLNKHACNYLDAHPNVGPTGIIMMDYAGDGNGSGHYGASLVAKIIANNNANTLLPVFEGPAAEYFLQNVETGLWLQGNTARTTTSRNAWNTAANVGTYGRPFLLQGFADDDWTLNTQAGDQILGCGYGDANMIYLDWQSGEAKRWRITGTKDAAHLNTWWDRWLSVDNNNRIVHDASTNDTWKLWTREERLANLSTASETNPIDVTWLMVNPELMNNDKMTPQWTASRSGGNQAWPDGFRPNRIFETWNFTSLDFYQIINNLPDGKYRVRAHAYYSPTGLGSTNMNDYNDYVANGQNTVKAVLYANGEEVKLPSIYSFTNDTQKADYTNRNLGSGVNIIDGPWQAARAMGEGDDNGNEVYQTDWLRVDVAGGSLRLGIKNTEGNPSSNWVVIGNFSLEYLGPLDNEIEALRSELSGLINDTFTGNTTDILQSNYDTAHAAASAAIADDNSSAATLTTCINNLRNAITAARAVDVTVLRPTVAYIKDRGIDVSAQEDFLANGTTNEVANQQNAAINALKWEVADKSTQPTIYSMPSESVVGTDDNTPATFVNDHADGYYVYNVGTGRWFCGGDEWGAHAAVGFPGIKITTPENNYGTGHYNSVITWLFNGDWGNGGQLNNGGYCDTGGNAWKFWRQDAANGIYTWSKNGDNTGNNTGLGCGTQGLVGFVPTTYARVNVDRTGADNPYNQWIFVTEAQRDAMAAAAMETASEENPVDLTYKIKMPGFNQRERKEGTNQSTEELDWTCNHVNYRYDAADNNSRHLIMGRGDNHPDFVCDVYGYSWNDAFSLTQTITGLTPGRYSVMVQGYNRYGDDANKACLVANGQRTALVDHGSVSALPWTSGLPENTFDNPEYFQVGLYWNEAVCTVGNDGNLTLGVESPSVTGGHVVIFDNFRLRYVGPANLIDENAGADASTVHNLKGYWTDESFEQIVSTAGAKVYDLTRATNLPAGYDPTTVVAEGKDKNALYIVSDDGMLAKNTIKSNGADGYSAVSPIVFADGYELNTNEAYNFTANQGVTYTRGNVNMLNYATVVVPFDAPVPSAFTAFGIDTEEKNGEFFITFREASSLEAGKPYLLRPVNPTDEKQTMTLAVSGEGKAVVFGLDNSMTYAHGTYTFMTRPEGKNYYGVKSSPASEDHIKLSKLSGTGRVSPFRIYFEVPVDGDGNEAKINMVFEESTGIRQATTEEIGKLLDIYSINGQMVKKGSDSTLGLPAGVYIVNGKKVVIK